jgi:hypothetical protein
LIERIHKEKELNQSVIAESGGRQILYGAEVFLKHSDSGLFIKATNGTSEMSKIGNDCVLSDDFSGSMIFKVLPRYKSRQSGEIIEYNDQLIFQNVKYGTYFSFNSDSSMLTDSEYELSDENPYRPQQFTFDPNQNVFRAFLSQASEISWQVRLFRSFNTPKAQVLGNDLVYLRHTELNGYLSASLRFNDQEPEVYIRNYKGDVKLLKDSLANIWEFQKLTLDQSGTNFEMEKLVIDDDSGMKISPAFRLRHFLSGKLLTVERNKRNGKLILASADDKSTLAYDNFIPLVCLPILQNITKLEYRVSYYIAHYSHRIMSEKDLSYIKCQENGFFTSDNIGSKLRDQDPQYDQIFTPARDDEIQEFRRVFDLFNRRKCTPAKSSAPRMLSYSRRSNLG